MNRMKQDEWSVGSQSNPEKRGWVFDGGDLGFAKIVADPIYTMKERAFFIALSVSIVDPFSCNP